VKNLVTIIALFLCSASALAEPHRSSVIVLPVTIIHGAGSAWIGESVERSLQADLRNASIAHPGGIAMDDPAAIASIAHNASADYVVQGGVQIVADQVRLSAKVFDGAGKSIGAGKATGDLRHLFDLEDSVADQIRDLIDKTTAAKHPATTPIPAIQESGPIRIAPAQVLPIGTVPESYSSTALRDGRDRYIYQVPYYGCFGPYGCGGYGYGGFGGFGCFGGVFNGSYSTGGNHALAW
jgi:TolB-like protein